MELGEIKKKQLYIQNHINKYGLHKYMYKWTYKNNTIYIILLYISYILYWEKRFYLKKHKFPSSILYYQFVSEAIQNMYIIMKVTVYGSGIYDNSSKTCVASLLPCKKAL